MSTWDAWQVLAYLAVFAIVGGVTGAATFELARSLRWRRANAAARASAVQSGTVTLQGTDQLKFHDGMAVEMSSGTGDAQYAAKRARHHGISGSDFRHPAELINKRGPDGKFVLNAQEREACSILACLAGHDECYVTHVDLERREVGLSTSMGGFVEWTRPFDAVRVNSWRNHQGSWRVGDIVRRPGT